MPIPAPRVRRTGLEPADVVKNSHTGGFTVSTHTVGPFERKTNSEALSAAGRKRHDPRIYARSIVKKWPALDENARAELRDILSPIISRQANTRTALTASEDGGRSDA